MRNSVDVNAPRPYFGFRHLALSSFGQLCDFIILSAFISWTWNQNCSKHLGHSMMIFPTICWLRLLMGSWANPTMWSYNFVPRDGRQ
jgi:hypothetical protein